MNMFAVQDSAGGIFLRFGETDREELLKFPGTGPFMDMREYVRIPEAILSNADQLDDWVERSYQYVVHLPPKPAKRTKK